MLEFWNEMCVKKSKKSHKCQLCGGEIPAGSEYVRQNGKFDGEFFDRCLHPWCCSAIEKYCQATGDNEYDDWAVLDYVQEEVCTACPEYEGGCCVKRVMTCEKVITKYGGSEHE